MYTDSAGCTAKTQNTSEHTDWALKVADELSGRFDISQQNACIKTIVDRLVSERNKQIVVNRMQAEFLTRSIEEIGKLFT